MSTTIQATFATRRDADMAVEHLVQEHGIERTDIFVAARGAGNSAGTSAAGSDIRAAEEGQEQHREDAPLNGGITVSVDLEDDTSAPSVRATFADFGGVRE